MYDANGTQTGYNYVQAPYVKASNGTVTCTVSDGSDTQYTLTPIDESQRLYSISYKDGNTYRGVLDYEMRLNRVYPMFYIVKCIDMTGHHAEPEH